MRKYFIIYFLLYTLFFVNSQEPESTTELPMGFREIKLGLNIDDVKEVLTNDGYFNYTGDPDVSMLLTDNRSIIECSGSYYISNGYFQFYNETLYTITLILNTEKIDYHTIFTTFVNKYGKYNSLSPDRVVWKNDSVKITLEKPLTIKYVGLGIYNKLIEQNTTEKAIEDQLREDFINEF